MPRAIPHTPAPTAILAALLCTLGVLPASVSAASYERSGVATATAEANILRMTALTSKEMIDCLTRTFPGEDRVAEMPNASVKFHQDGSRAQSVLVTFIANWPIPTGSDLPSGSQPAGAFIFLEIDGDRVDVVSEQGGVLVHEGTATSVSNGTHGFTFITEPISPGDHTARILWSNNLLTGTGTICVLSAHWWFSTVELGGRSLVRRLLRIGLIHHAKVPITVARGG